MGSCGTCTFVTGLFYLVKCQNVHLAGVRIASFLRLNKYLLYGKIAFSFLICPWTLGLGCFHLLTVVSNAAVSTGVHVSVHVPASTSPGCVLQRGILGRMVTVCNFLRPLHPVFHSGCTTSRAHRRCTRCGFSTSSQHVFSAVVGGKRPSGFESELSLVGRFPERGRGSFNAQEEARPLLVPGRDSDGARSVLSESCLRE